MNAQLTPSRLLLLAALVCFVVALLEATGTVAGTDVQQWTIGGFVALTGSLFFP